MHKEEHSHQDRWLVSYADFMTLLFALFVVLFASAYRDKQAIKQVSSAVRNGFQDMGAFSSNAKRGEDPAQTLSDQSDVVPDVNGAMKEFAPETKSGGIDVIGLQKKLNQVLGKEIARQEVAMRMTPEGFVISLHELGFFNSGQAKLLPGAADKIKRLATVLMQYGLDMRVEGHSDNVPIHNAQFNSNWDLSTARAMAVSMMLLHDAGFDPERMSIAGYAEYHPTASNDTPEGRRANRRVDIVIVAIDKHASTPTATEDAVVKNSALPAP
ncbi:MAG: OmpA family protein [Acidobacteriaceae bacterium]|nr:OmpA family protein [Acidobacteriaceae bacterium]